MIKPWYRRYQVKWHARKLGVRILNEVEANNFVNNLDALKQVMGAYSFAGTNTDNTTGVKDRAIYIDPNEPTEETKYFTYLHELAHHALKHHDMPWSWKSKGQFVKEEIEAWDWAWHKSLGSPSDEAVCYMLDCLSTYTDDAAGLVVIPVTNP